MLPRRALHGSWDSYWRGKGQTPSASNSSIAFSGESRERRIVGKVVTSEFANLFTTDGLRAELLLRDRIISFGGIMEKNCRACGSAEMNQDLFGIPRKPSPEDEELCYFCAKQRRIAEHLSGLAATIEAGGTYWFDAHYSDHVAETKGASQRIGFGEHEIFFEFTEDSIFRTQKFFWGQALYCGIKTYSPVSMGIDVANILEIPGLKELGVADQRVGVVFTYEDASSAPIDRWMELLVSNSSNISEVTHGYFTVAMLTRLLMNFLLSRDDPDYGTRRESIVRAFNYSSKTIREMSADQFSFFWR